MMFEGLPLRAWWSNSGNKVMESTTSSTGRFTIHSAVRGARRRSCVMHLHTTQGIAVSAQKEGLLPISQQSLFALASISYHDYEGLALNDDEKPRLVADLGTTKFMILRNHGLLTVGETAADAFLGMFTLQRACEIQVLAQAGGNDELLPVAAPMVSKVTGQFQAVTVGQLGQLAWPGLLRKLDRIDPSFRE